MGDILESEQNALRFLALACYRASAKQQCSTAESLQLQFNFEVIEKALSGQQLMKQHSQFGNVPSFSSNVINSLSYRVSRRKTKCFIESKIGPLDFTRFIEHGQRFPNRFEG